MPWAVLLLLVPVVLFALTARRAIRAMALLRDPEKLRQLLSQETRDALARAGFDPDSLDLQALQKSPELARLVGADLQRALRDALLGRGVPMPATTPGIPEIAPASGSKQAGQPLLPPPIDAPSHSHLGLRLVFLLGVLALSAAAIRALGSP